MTPTSPTGCKCARAPSAKRQGGGGGGKPSLTDHAGQPDARSAPPLRYFFVPQRRWRRPRRPVRNCGWRPPVPDWRVAHGALPMGRPSGHGDGRGWPRQPKQRRHPRAVWRPGRSLSALLSMVHRFPYRFLYVKAHRKVSCVQDKMLRCGQSVCARHVIRYCSACKFLLFFLQLQNPKSCATDRGRGQRRKQGTNCSN